MFLPFCTWNTNFVEMLLQLCMAWVGESQEFHAKNAHCKWSEGVGLCPALACRLVPIHGAIFEECWTWSAGLPLCYWVSLLTATMTITIFHSFCLLGHWQVHFLYKGTLRVLLVLLHDFPEFLCDYHFTFCDVIPPSCIQMRNIILSAFPRNMRLPDPSTPNLKVPDWLYVILVNCFIKRKIPDGNWFFFYLQIDLLAEIRQSPRILSEVDAALKVKQMKTDVDEYLKVLVSPGGIYSF